MFFDWIKQSCSIWALWIVLVTNSPNRAAIASYRRGSRFRPLLIAAAATSALAACSLLPPATKTSVPPPSPALGRDLPAATAGSAYGVANTGGVFPHGAIRKGDSDVAQEPTAETTDRISLNGAVYSPGNHGRQTAIQLGRRSTWAPGV